MERAKITVAWFWPKSDGFYESGSEIAEGLDSRFRVIHIYLTKDNGNRPEDRYGAVHFLSTTRRAKFFNPLILWRLVKILRKEKVEILHCHEFKPTFLGMIAARLAGTPVVISQVHGISETQNWTRKPLSFLVFKGVDKVLAPGKAAVSYILENNPHLAAEKVCSLGESDPGRIRNELESIYGELAVQKGLANQYYIISYPKSGRTWLRLLIAKVLQVRFGLKVKREDFFEIQLFSSYNKAVPSIVVDHYPDGQTTWSGRMEDLKRLLKRYASSKVIFLVRDPRDVVVSHFFQDTKRPKKNPELFYQGSISEYIRDQKYGLDGIIKFCNLWASQRNVPKDFLLVRYEDLHRNGLDELKRVTDFLGLANVTDAQLKEAVDFASFGNMQKFEREDYFKTSMLRPGDVKDTESYKTRKGKVAGFYNYLGKEDIDFLNNKLSAEFNDFFGYEFTFASEEPNREKLENLVTESPEIAD